MSNEVVSDWRVATYTGGQGNCVEVGTSATMIAVRDTKNREDGPVLRFDPSRVARVYAASQGLALLANRSPARNMYSVRAGFFVCPEYPAARKHKDPSLMTRSSRS